MQSEAPLRMNLAVVSRFKPLTKKMTGMSFFISRRTSSTCVSCQLGLGCSATTRSKGSERSRCPNCSGVTTISRLRVNRAFLSSDKQCSTSARNRWTKRIRTRLRLSPMMSRAEARVPCSMSGFCRNGSKKRLKMPGWRFFSAPNRPPALVSVTSYERYGLRLALSVQYCTGGTSPVSDKAHFRPVPIGGTDGSACHFLRRLALSCRLQYHVVH